MNLTSARATVLKIDFFKFTIAIIFTASMSGIYVNETAAQTSDPSQPHFPTDASRLEIADRPDLGSGGADANTNKHRLDIRQGKVLALPFTISELPAKGRLVFVGTVAPPTVGADLHLWISEDADSPRTSSNCSYVGFVEGVMNVVSTNSIFITSTDSVGMCALPGGDYWLNIAACAEEQADGYRCVSEGALASKGSGSIYIKSNWDITDAAPDLEPTDVSTIDVSIDDQGSEEPDAEDPCMICDPTDSGDSDSGDSDSGDSDEQATEVNAVGPDGEGFGEASIISSKLVLEEPASGGTYAGIGAIRGWAVDRNGALTTDIEIYVDGSFVGSIAHGDTRIDVGNAFPSLKNSSDSGFAAAFNYADLNPGAHTLTVKAKDSFGTLLEEQTTFTVVRFGDKKFLSGLNIPSGNSASQCSLTGNTLICKSVLVGDQTFDVVWQWNSATQNFEITDIQRD